MAAIANGSAKRVWENLTNEPQLYSQPKTPPVSFSLAFFFKATPQRCVMHRQKTSPPSIRLLRPARADVVSDAHVVEHACH